MFMLCSPSVLASWALKVISENRAHIVISNIMSCHCKCIIKKKNHSQTIWWVHAVCLLVTSEYTSTLLYIHFNHNLLALQHIYNIITHDSSVLDVWVQVVLVLVPNHHLCNLLNRLPISGVCRHYSQQRHLSLISIPAYICQHQLLCLFFQIMVTRHSHTAIHFIHTLLLLTYCTLR